MARFKYLGEPQRTSSFVAYGPTSQIRIPKKDGTFQIVIGPPGGFVIGKDIGAVVTDERALRTMRADTRFDEIV